MSDEAGRHWWDTRAQAGTQAARIRQNAMLQGGFPSLLWGLGRGVDSRLWPYAVACLEMMLHLSDAACSAYAAVVESWGLAGCQEVKEAGIARWPETHDWLLELESSYYSGSSPPMFDIPGAEMHQENRDVAALAETAAAFVILNFNRSQDIANERYKVIPWQVESFALVKAIAVRSVIDYENYDAAKLRRYRDPEINAIMTASSWPNYRTDERGVRSEVTNTLKGAGFRKKADATLLDRAWKWCNSRVVHTGPEAFTRAYYKEEGVYLDPRNVDREIKECDLATGYPRRK